MKRGMFVVAAICALIGAGAVWAEEAAVGGQVSIKTAEAAPAAGHCLAIKGDQAVFCDCAADCKCTLNADGKQCSCGKPVTTRCVAGKYVCAACAQIADKAGKCPKCGAEMTKVEKPTEVKPQQ